MSRLNITLSPARYRALKEASAQRDKTIGQLIDEGLDFYGLKSREGAQHLARPQRHCASPGWPARPESNGQPPA